MQVRFCTRCEMYHNEETSHLSAKQVKESQDYDVYHANGTIYFSPEHVEDEIMEES